MRIIPYETHGYNVRARNALQEKKHEKLRESAGVNPSTSVQRITKFISKSEGYSKRINQSNKIPSTMAKFVASFKWSHWCTFTFSRVTSENGARRQMERLHERFQHLGLRCLYYVTERGGKYDRIHVHAIGQFENGSADIIWEFWKSKFGRCQIRPFRKEGGAIEYITNYFLKGTVDWDILGIPKTKI